MLKNPVPLAAPVDAIVFDCDGTLSRIEGIDELALLNGVSEPVKQLTAIAMGQTGINPEIYHQRLALVKPTQQQVAALGQQYFEHKVAELLPVLKTLRGLGKIIYVVSAGLLPAVADFAKLLEIDAAQVFAVDITFDAVGNYVDFDRNSPLVHAFGKRKIVEQILQKHARLAYVGDGLNDYETADLVTRFIGYGGAFYRENLAQLCDYYITTAAMTPLLSLALTAEELQASLSAAKVL